MAALCKQSALNVPRALRTDNAMKLIATVLCFFGIFLSKTLAEGECEFVFVANTTVQEFSTANYPLNYENHLNCVWIVKADNPDDKVEIQFTDVDTEACCDFIRIRDGQSSASPLLMPLSGNRSRTRYFASTYDALRISFSSDDSITGKGLSVQYRIAVIEGPENCGGQVAATTISSGITSPGWPNYEYPDNAFCLWTVTAPEGQLIQITFKSYRLETCCDSVLLRDGSDANSRTIAYIRGSNYLSETYETTGNILQIRFRSDQSKSFAGFFSYVESVNPSNVTEGNGTSVGPIDPECEGELEAPPSGHGNFSSPGYPNKHPNDLNCVWIIRAAEGERVRVWFSYIKLEPCCDWIKVRDGENFDSTKLGVISSNPKTFHSYVSTSNVMRVEFDSDETVGLTGFFAYYETYNPIAEMQTSSCGGNLTADATPQYFSTPNFPNGTYTSGTVCTWIIRAPFGTQVRLNMMAIVLSGFDTLSVFNGDSRYSRRIVGFRSKHRYKYRITTSGNTARVRLVSLYSQGHAGFRATYKAVVVKTDKAEVEDEDVDPK